MWLPWKLPGSVLWKSSSISIKNTNSHGSGQRSLPSCWERKMNLVNILRLLLLGRKNPHQYCRELSSGGLNKDDQASLCSLSLTHQAFADKEARKKSARSVISYLPEIFSLEFFSYLSITTQSVSLSCIFSPLFCALACSWAKSNSNSNS